VDAEDVMYSATLPRHDRMGVDNLGLNQQRKCSVDPVVARVRRRHTLKTHYVATPQCALRSQELPVCEIRWWRCLASPRIK
jgi:hypothetical protein